MNHFLEELIDIYPPINVWIDANFNNEPFLLHLLTTVDLTQEEEDALLGILNLIRRRYIIFRDILRNDQQEFPPQRVPGRRRRRVRGLLPTRRSRRRRN